MEPSSVSISKDKKGDSLPLKALPCTIMYHHHHTFQGRKLTDQERARVLEFQESIHYSPRYSDDTHEYRHVMLPKAMLKVVPSDYFNSETGTLRILTEDEWRGIGVTQSLGWEHYECHAPEPHILLFKRPLNYEVELRAAAAAVAAAQQQQQQQQVETQVSIPQ